tara:strand:- start:102 stop:635 length:534 start_codon:yes stop_codon:yes gene_type:complete
MIDFYQKDNFFTKEESSIIEDILYNQEIPFPIFYDISQTCDDKIPFFSHGLIERDGKRVSTYCDFFLPIFERFIKTTNIKPTKILRAAVNLTLPFVGESTIHVDHDEEYYQCIMYLNNSTGETEIYEDEKLIKSIKPLKGRIIMFNALKHRGNSSTNANELRAICVLTFSNRISQLI